MILGMFGADWDDRTYDDSHCSLANKWTSFEESLKAAYDAGREKYLNKA